MKEDVCEFIRRCAADPSHDAGFEALAQELFRWQRENVPDYRRFVGDIESSVSYRQHPVPTPLFTRFRFCAGESTVHFQTSGTTAGIRGHHYMPDAEAYALSVTSGVARLPFAIPTSNTVSLCPNSEEFPESSLGRMIAILSPSARSFFSRTHGVHQEACWANLRQQNEPVFLASTALALADLLDEGSRLTLPHGSVLMITGGYKGQQKSIPEALLHQKALQQLGSSTQLIREYGMTELSSQLWDWGEGYRAPPWLKVWTQFPDTAGVGQLCFADLANWGSCMVVETQDMGRVQDGVVELLGRIPGMRARGCSLVAEEAR